MFWGAFFVQLAVSATLMVLAYAIMPKPKAAKPEAARDLEAPTAEAGRPIPVVFGTMWVKGSNILYYTNKGKASYQVKA